MSKPELVDSVSKLVGEEVTKTTISKVIDAVAQVTQENLKETGKAALPGIGNLSVSERKPRPRRNPKTGEVLGMSEGGKVPKFSAAKPLKDAVK